jgi:hypothetical protein
MLRWLIYLVILSFMGIVALIVTPFLPLFAVERYGPINNNTGMGTEPRLPLWLAWFDTPDNSLLGDLHWKQDHPKGGYWSRVGWLYRNRLYGFKWGPIAAPWSQPIVVHGDPDINYATGHFGEMDIKMNCYWQWKIVKRIGKTRRCWVINMGWLLDNTSSAKALYMFSPRLKKVPDSVELPG